jgi:hypothetical protein
MTSLGRKKFKSVPLAGRFMVAVFWDEKGVIFVSFLPRRTTVNSNCYIEALRSLNACLH